MIKLSQGWSKKKLDYPICVSIENYFKDGVKFQKIEYKRNMTRGNTKIVKLKELFRN